MGTGHRWCDHFQVEFANVEKNGQKKVLPCVCVTWVECVLLFKSSLCSTCVPSTYHPFTTHCPHEQLEKIHFLRGLDAGDVTTLT